MHSEFLLDSLGEHLYITADPQFGSQRLFQHLEPRRRFGSLKALHDTLVDNWNACVGEEDVVLCLGDFTQNLPDRKQSMKVIETYTARLNGRKLLIRGNHDVEETCWYYDYGWNSLIEYPLVALDGHIDWLSVPSQYCGCVITEVGGRRILFSHFALFENDGDDCRYLMEKAYLRKLFAEYDCEINIHGHTHQRAIADPRCHCACVESHGFSPVRLGDFLRRPCGASTPDAA